VPWHDAGWNGAICKDPKGNAACLALDRIRATRNDEQEVDSAEKLLTELPPELWPACIGERGSFMSAFDYTRRIEQPYSKTSDLHRHILPTDVRLPAYSAGVIPFRWMNRKFAWDLAREHDLPVDPSREPKEPDWLRKNNWVQNHDNQRALLDGFIAAIEKEKSLCFFYAKLTPLTEDERRILIGIGRVSHYGNLKQYKYAKDDGIRAYIWDRPVQHSIRQDFKDGFLMPYRGILERVEKDPNLDGSDYIAYAPDDRGIEFSYASEHVTHDGAIAALLSCKAALEKCRGVVDEPVDRMLKWIDLQLGRLWKLRGPYPGLGAALTAFGLEYGSFIGYEIASQLDENTDPWPLVDKVFRNPALLPSELASQVTTELQKKWKEISARKPKRLELLKLLARFEVTAEQATCYYVPEEREGAGIACSDEDLLNNPYHLYELDRVSPEPISVWTVDRGMFPVPSVREKHPLSKPSKLSGPTDSRRVRALAISQLEVAASEGHTLQPRADIVRSIRDLSIEPSCPVDGDLFDVIADDLVPAITHCCLRDGAPAYKLERLTKVGKIIQSTVERRLSGKPIPINVPWTEKLERMLGKVSARDTDEKCARLEKAAAVKAIAESRISVLIGPAGTGKTTLLSVLCNEPNIRNAGVLLLAPTGKARVRLQQSTGIPAKTIAQFLRPLDRYDEWTGAYHLSARDKIEVGKTVIIDESSMLTEEQLGSVLDAVKGVDRLILVGDPRQLPPIGAGRPFLDIVTRLASPNVGSIFPRVGKGYAELTVRRRQLGQVREDLQLAEWFSGRPLGPGEDEILNKILTQDEIGNCLRFVSWKDSGDLEETLLGVLVQELHLNGPNDTETFESTLGGTRKGDYTYFNTGAAKGIDGWQILTPVRGMPWGVLDVNRLIQLNFRSKTIEFAKTRYRQITKPMGPEGIVYGDKVINVANRTRKDVFPESVKDKGQAEIAALKYVANGEMGIVVGQFKPRLAKWSPWKLEVEFSSQPGFKYDFGKHDFKEEANPILELAYAITIHKAQGSEFDLCILVLPNPCRLLSRELLYTALTRQRSRIIILHQGQRDELKKLASDYYSESAKRLTDLFGSPRPVKIDDRFLEDRLIHRSGKGEPMRSKSEVIVADALAEAGIDYVYEQKFTGDDGQVRYPDFTIEDSETGTKYIWEHCGLLENESYRARWERKLLWFRSQRIVPREEGGGEMGTLIISRDTPQGGISSQEIKAIIKDIWK
jgi:ATP-dependent exoDNAse (exonuclease V), alpha subunit - helicase superfamily I member